MLAGTPYASYYWIKENDLVSKNHLIIELQDQQVSQLWYEEHRAEWDHLCPSLTPCARYCTFINTIFVIAIAFINCC